MADQFSYRSIVKEGNSLLKEKGSKFYGLAVSIKDESEIKSYSEELKKKYKDANHVCYGFVLDDIEGKSDDGEPSHSAGDPILGQIKSMDVINAAVFVSRIFGGTKLGVGGLKQAYKIAALMALEDSKIKEFDYQSEFEITFEYDQTGIIQRWITDFQGQVIKEEYKDKSKLLVSVPTKFQNQFEQNLNDNTYLGIGYKVKKET